VSESWLFRLSRWLPYVYLLRVPLLTVAGVIGFCFAALCIGARALLGNAFDIGGAWGIFFVSLTAFLCSWVVMVTWRLVRLYGGERFLDTASFPIASDLRTRDLIYFSPIALFVVIGAIWKSTAFTVWWELFEAVLGLLASLFLLAVVAVVQRWLIPSRVAQRRPMNEVTRGTELARTAPNLFFPSGIRPFDRLLESLGSKNPTQLRVLNAIENLCRRIPEEVGRGYFEYDKKGNGESEFRSILPGHVAAFILLLLTIAVYYVIGLCEFARLKEGKAATVPALCYVMLLAMLLCWGLSSLTFLLDRWRIPLLLPVVLILIATSFFPIGDYFYPARKPVQAHEAVPPSSQDSIIVVAANGGGIQAAVWTAKVLTGLEKRCNEKCDRDFGESIRVISSASGGSVGTMYFVNEYGEDGSLPEEESKLNDIVERTEASSLDSIAWGLVYQDLRHTLAPFFKYDWDRGRALEQSWLRSSMEWARRTGIEKGLSEWRNKTIQGSRPAVIFNATVVETGRPVTFNTLPTTMAPKGSPEQLELLSSYRGVFEDGEKETDVKVVTAARLSAAFPYVSPAARADPGKVGDSAPHIVDGGYYDNFGISSLVEWLDAELTRNQNIENVLIVEIRGGPSETGVRNKDDKDCSQQPEDQQDLYGKQEWAYQLFAPAETVLNVRKSAQRARNDVELDLLVDKWSENDEHRVAIERATFEYDCPDPPLSWHLTEAQKVDIDQEWQDEIDDEVEQVQDGSDDNEGGWRKIQDYLAEDGDRR
jgi:predicted acylesterase/phospholipase RssA